MKLYGHHNVLDHVTGSIQNGNTLGIVCLWFYTVSTVLQLFNTDSSKIHVSWSFNQCFTNPLSRHWPASRSAIPIVLSTKRGSLYYQFLRLWSVAAGDRTHNLPLTRWTLKPLGHRDGHILALDIRIWSSCMHSS